MLPNGSVAQRKQGAALLSTGAQTPDGLSAQRRGTMPNRRSRATGAQRARSSDWLCDLSWLMGSRHSNFRCLRQ